MALTFEVSGLVSVIVQAVAYGFFVFLYVHSALVILRQYHKSIERRSTHVRLLLVSTTMLLGSTVYFAISIYTVLAAFIWIGSTSGNDIKAITERLTSTDNSDYLANAAVYGLITALGDGFMIYRVFMVWAGDVLVCLPLVLSFLGSLASGLVYMVTCSHSATYTTTANMTTTPWLITFFALTMCVNGGATGLIAGRILWMNRRINVLYSASANGYRINLQPVVTAIVESAALYSVSMIALIVLYLRGSPAQHLVQDSMPQIMGIIFTFIIIRVSLGTSGGVTHQATSPNTAMTDIRFQYETRPESSDNDVINDEAGCP